ncbi:MAG: nucleotidyltransferase family protein [Clostridia bacterium]|nr:nucleotidyltransferase family protein [Clostridia bacterium]
MTHTAEELVALLRAAVSGVPLPEGFVPRDPGALFRLAARQDLGHLLYDTLAAAGLLPEGELQEALCRERLRAVWRYGNLAYEEGRILATLREEGIDCLPLKGAAVRSLWPEPWMRTSCDIDLLVRREDTSRATEALKAALGYTVREVGYRDISLWSPGDLVHLELQFSLREGSHADPVLARVWEYATPGEDGVFRLDPAFRLFHLLSHLAYHLLAGGGGMRQVVDLYLLTRHPYDRDILDALLCEAGLLTFGRAALRLAEVWLGEGESDALSEALGRALAEGALYADLARRAANERAKTPTRPARRQARQQHRAYVRERLFLPRCELMALYPVLLRHAWLLPFCQVHRWCRLLLGGRLRFTLRRARAAARVTQEEADAARRLLSDLGLIDEKK